MSSILDELNEETLNEKDSSYFKNLIEKSTISLDEELTPPETLISCGTYQYKGRTYPKSIMTSGEFSVITAPSKAKKSFFKSALLASYIGGNTSSYFPSIKSHRTDDFTIIDIDTEQGQHYAQRTFRRVIDLVGLNYEYYKPYATRNFTEEERIELIDYLLENQSKLFEKPIKLISIDGIADLIENTNDIILSKKVLTKFLKWTYDYNIHITTIIHQASGTTKPTGHAGSFTLKKAENIISLEPDEATGIISVKNTLSRGMKFDNIEFIINKDSLPEEYRMDYIDNDTPF